MKRSVETSCIIRSFANNLKSGSGDNGFRVFGSSGGGRGSGRSASMLYQWVGISSCGRYTARSLPVGLFFDMGCLSCCLLWSENIIVAFKTS